MRDEVENVPLEGAAEQGFISEGEANTDAESSDEVWLQRSRTAWESGEDWFNSTMRRRVERNLAHYNMEHEPESVYHKEEYKKRSRLFRPRTRTAIRKLIAAAGKAYFATVDVVHCNPVNERNPDDVLAAEIHNALLNHRLTHSVPWYKVVMGGVTDAAINGVVISRQFWDFEEGKVPEVRFINGKPERHYRDEVMRDRPMVRIVPIENFRVAPGTDWCELIDSSPFIIEQVPYFLSDLEDLISLGKSRVPYRSDEVDNLTQAVDTTYDSIRAKRERNSRDRYSDTFAGTNEDFGIVWVRKVIVRIDGQDWYYETAGESVLLSDPVPLDQIHPTGRNYVVGSLEIEPHALYPSGLADLGYNSQQESNVVANTRIDNVLQAMIGRWLVKRGRQTDIRSLMRNVAGSVTYSQDIADVKDIRPQDVTRSAYEEQDRISNDMDDLLGLFSQSTVAGNRELNETFRGMLMLSDNANEVMEMQLKNFTMTWYMPVLQQLVNLERHYESDRKVLELVGEDLGQDLQTVFRALHRDSNVQVNVGFGNLNPLMRIERLRTGLSALEELAPGSLAGADVREIGKEIFGALGYSDGKRFLPNLFDEEVDPQVQQLEQQIAELTSLLEGKQLEIQGRVQVAQINAQIKQVIEGMRQQHDKHMKMLESEMKRYDLMIRQEENEVKKRQLAMQREALSHTITMANREFELKISQITGAMPPEAGDGTQELAQDLREPGSGEPVPDPLTALRNQEDGGEAKSEPIVEMGDDAGVVARGDYGTTPFLEG